MLEAQGVFHAYERQQWVLDDVDARIFPGQVTGVVGPNGSGKSTLLRLFSGLLTPQRGAVLANGQPLRAQGARGRARLLGFLPQAVNPAFSLSAFEVVCLGRYPHTGGMGSLRQPDLEVARRCMARTKTEALHLREFSTLSGGERQRVLLASILAQEPRFLLLDEPTSALDIHHQVEVMALLQTLATEGYGIGLVTHDLNLAAQYCDAMVLLDAAHRVAAAGAPREVLTSERLSAAYGAHIRVGAHPFAPLPFVAAAPPQDAP